MVLWYDDLVEGRGIEDSLLITAVIDYGETLRGKIDAEPTMRRTSDLSELVWLVRWLGAEKEANILVVIPHRD